MCRMRCSLDGIGRVTLPLGIAAIAVGTAWTHSCQSDPPRLTMLATSDGRMPLGHSRVVDAKRPDANLIQVGEDRLTVEYRLAYTHIFSGWGNARRFSVEYIARDYPEFVISVTYRYTADGRSAVESWSARKREPDEWLPRAEGWSDEVIY